jgi:hypothetical protein
MLVGLIFGTLFLLTGLVVAATISLNKQKKNDLDKLP